MAIHLIDKDISPDTYVNLMVVLEEKSGFNY